MCSCNKTVCFIPSECFKATTSGFSHQQGDPSFTKMVELKLYDCLKVTSSMGYFQYSDNTWAYMPWMRWKKCLPRLINSTLETLNCRYARKGEMVLLIMLKKYLPNYVSLRQEIVPSWLILISVADLPSPPKVK